MRLTDWRLAPFLVMVASPLVLAGCAGHETQASTGESGSAMAVANQSKAEADRAMSTAQQALNEAREAKEAAERSSTASNRMYQRSLQK